MKLLSTFPIYVIPIIFFFGTILNRPVYSAVVQAKRYESVLNTNVSEDDRGITSFELAIAAIRYDNLKSLSNILSKHPDLTKQHDGNGWSLLHEAVMSNKARHVSEVLKYIDDVSDVNMRMFADQSGGNAMWMAKRRGTKEIIKLLEECGGVEMGIDEYDPYSEEETEKDDLIFFEGAIEAIRNDNFKSLSIMLSKQPELVKLRDESGWSLLHEAVMSDSAIYVKTVLKYIDDVADVNLRMFADQSGGNAMWMAIGIGNEDIIDLLEDHGGEKIAPDNYDDHEEYENKDLDDEEEDIEEEEYEDIPFTFQDAVYAMQYDSDLLSTILEKQPELTEETDANNWRLLHRASYLGKIDCVAIIASHQKDLDVRISFDEKGGNAVWLASSQKHYAVVDYLIAKGARMLAPVTEKVIVEPDEEEEEEEEEILFTYQEAVYALRYDNEMLLEILRRQPELTEETDENGWNLLHKASYLGKIESVATIILHQKDLDTRIQSFTNKKGGNAVWLASSQKHYAVVDYLVDNGARMLTPI